MHWIYVTEEDTDLAAALALSLSDDSPDMSSTRDTDEDEQIRQALLLSLQSEPPTSRLPGTTNSHLLVYNDE